MTLQESGPARVAITRSREGNRALAEKLERAGLEPVAVDAITISPVDDWRAVDDLIRKLDGFDWLVFTSAAGAESFAARLKALGTRLPEGRPLLAAVGKPTAMALSSLGAAPVFVPSRYTNRALGEELPAGKGSKVALLRADIADPRLAELLTERGFAVEEVVAYKTAPSRGPAVSLQGVDLIIFASPSAVKGLCGMVRPEELAALKRVKAICIGPVTSSAAQASGFRDTVVPDSYTLDAVVREAARLTQGDA